MAPSLIIVTIVISMYLFWEEMSQILSLYQSCYSVWEDWIKMISKISAPLHFQFSTSSHILFSGKKKQYSFATWLSKVPFIYSFSQCCCFIPSSMPLTCIHVSDYVPWSGFFLSFVWRPWYFHFFNFDMWDNTLVPSVL
jgi:hypothetical protein